MAVMSEVIVESTFVRLRCTGSCASALELQQVMSDAVHAARLNQRLKVLVDGSQVTGRLSDLDRYEIATFLHELHLQEQVRPVAIAIVGQEPLVDPARFGETVARNRGVNGRVFTELDEAIDWLVCGD